MSRRAEFQRAQPSFSVRFHQKEPDGSGAYYVTWQVTNVGADCSEFRITKVGDPFGMDGEITLPKCARNTRAHIRVKIEESTTEDALLITFFDALGQMRTQIAKIEVNRIFEGLTGPSFHVHDPQIIYPADIAHLPAT